MTEEHFDYRTLFEAVPGAYLVLLPNSPVYTIVAVTNEYLRATLSTREGLLGKGLFEAFPDNPDDPTATGSQNLRASLDRALETREPDTMAIQHYDIRRPDGTWEERYWSPVNIPLVSEGRSGPTVTLMIHRVQDVTEAIRLEMQERKSAEAAEQWQRQALEMQSELIQRATELHEANTRLRDAHDRVTHVYAERERVLANEREARRAVDAAVASNAAKSQFLTKMSHELRTPLNAIAGYVDLVLLGVHGPITDAQRQALDRVRRSEQHLLSLITDILDFNRLEAGTLSYDIRDVSLETLLLDVEALMEPQASARGIEFHSHSCAADLVVKADGERVRQILLNLLTNAIKFTPEGGSVMLECDICDDPRDESVVCLRVKDTGRGIAESDLGILFDPFVQIDRHLTSISQQGVGLGLSISRELARAMGGDISVESKIGEGSVFTVTLPRGVG